MSEAKLAAARELIQEKEYAAARAVLRTTHEPKAREWLTKLDKIAPEIPVRNPYPIPPETPIRSNYAPPVSQEAERYYSSENKKRRRKRLANGIELIVGGVIVTALAMGMSAPRIGGVAQQSNPLTGVLFLAGVITFILGIVVILRRNRD